MLVESLEVSSHGFSLSFHFVLDIPRKPQISYLLCFSLLCVSPYFSFPFFILFSFHSFKYWKTFNTHVNQPVKLLSPPVIMDSTRFSLYAIIEVSRKPKHIHFNSWFQSIHFLFAISPDQILALLPGMVTVWFHIFVNFSSLLLVCRSNF